MAHTKAELATAVLRRLAAIDQYNNAPSAAEQNQIGGLYDDKLAELAAMDLVYWSNSGMTVAEIPGAVFGALIRIMCEEFANTTGRDIPTEQDEDGTPLSIGNKGLRMLRRQMSRPQSDLPTPMQYF